jgi:hypothetical protein
MTPMRRGKEAWNDKNQSPIDTRRTLGSALMAQVETSGSAASAEDSPGTGRL